MSSATRQITLSIIVDYPLKHDAEIWGAISNLIHKPEVRDWKIIQNRDLQRILEEQW